MNLNGNFVFNTKSSRSIPPPSDNYYRASLDFYGIFTLYYHPRSSGSNQSWSAAGSWPENIYSNINGLKGSGACCRLENRYDFLEIIYSNIKEDRYDFLEIMDTDWPLK